MRAGRIRLLWAAAVAAVAVIAVVATAIATNGKNVRGDLNGYEEVPAVSTVAQGSFTAQLARNGQSIEYRLTYSGLEEDATQAHIHFGQRDVVGGISVWLCGAPRTTPPVTPPAGFNKPCPTRAGTVTGTITAADVVGPANQGIAAGELGELIRAIRSGVAYANVHSVKFPGGEIRAPLRHGKGPRAQAGRGKGHRR